MRAVWPSASNVFPSADNSSGSRLIDGRGGPPQLRRHQRRRAAAEGPHVEGRQVRVAHHQEDRPDGDAELELVVATDGGGIFLMGRTGESVRRLTNGGFHPAWFPDGTSIVYASGEGPPGPENRTAFSEIWTVSVDGGEPRRLIAGDAVQPRVSPNGRRIAYWSMPTDPIIIIIGGVAIELIAALRL